jgi:hypothetical protein
MAVKTRRQREITADFLVGKTIAPAAVVNRGMKNIERQLQKEFREEVKAEAELDKRMSKIQSRLLTGLEKDLAVRREIQNLKQMHVREGRRKLTFPPLVREVETIFTGSIGATVVPPYNYQWTWNTSSGSPTVDVAANRNTGTKSFGLWTNPSGSSNAEARTAVGLYFRPATTNGILRIWANPSFNYRWWTICAFASAHSSAFIGLYVGKYTLAGGFVGAPVDQRITLWSDNSWWSGTGKKTGSNSGYPLFAQISVDNSHYYAIWVWCGGRISGKGWGTFSGSGAGAFLNARTPSISWELF